jgi:hypothetical protein
MVDEVVRNSDSRRMSRINGLMARLRCDMKALKASAVELRFHRTKIAKTWMSSVASSPVT